MRARRTLHFHSSARRKHEIPQSGASAPRLSGLGEGAFTAGCQETLPEAEDIKPANTTQGSPIRDSQLRGKQLQKPNEIGENR